MVQVVDRTLDILERIAHASEDISVSELHDALGLPLGTVHRLLATLVKRGYVSQDPRTRRYGPGPKLLEVGASAVGNARFGLQRIVHPYLEELTAETGETSNLVVAQGRDGVYLDQVASGHLVRMFTEIGRRAPLYCTGAGKAILAGLPERQFEQYLTSTVFERWTTRTITEPATLADDIAQARGRGFAIDDEEREIGVRCVAAPIFDGAGRCTGAISISGPTTRLRPERVDHAGELTRAAATRISRQLGFRLPESGDPS